MELSDSDKQRIEELRKRMSKEQNRELRAVLQELLDNMPTLITEIPSSAIDSLDMPVREAIIKAKQALNILNP